MRYLLPTLVSLPHVSVETLDVWSEEAVVLARETARKLLAGLMPGATGFAMADEIADKILTAVRLEDA
ncbi:hypothetical protein OG285_31615 [Streptomyces sp. NBC_01471]|uniref:hypothetical protein n=1 Tax=Streptomyces sp. NBC_01471 TaxID=2903879 RepID=UPI003252D96B